MRRGFGLIEIVVVTAIVTVVFFSFLQTGILAVRLLRNEKERLEAALLAQEALEAVRSVRDESWANIAWRTAIQNPSLPYYPVVQNGKWALSTTSPGLINDIYNRYLIFEKVNRDASDRIVASGGTDDQATRKIIARATSSLRTIELATYLTDFQAFVPRPTETVAVSYDAAATDADLANFPSQNAGNGDPGQSFTTLALPLQASKIELLLRRTTPAPSDIFVELRMSPTGTTLATSTVIGAATISDSAAAWVAFPFPEPVPLAAATNYIIRLRSIPDSTAAFSGSAGTIHWLYTQTATSPYAGGVARRYIGRLSNPADEGQLLDQYDFGFKIYALQ